MTYNVRFLNWHYENPRAVVFKADTSDDLDTIVSALAAFYSGDVCECFVNEEKVVLDRDFGLDDYERASLEEVL